MTVVVAAIAVVVLLVALVWATCFSGFVATGSDVADELKRMRSDPSSAVTTTLSVTTEGASWWWQNHLAEIGLECDALREAGKTGEADRLRAATQRDHDAWLALDDAARRQWVADRVDREMRSR